jgi:hypothetical protein
MSAPGKTTHADAYVAGLQAALRSAAGPVNVAGRAYAARVAAAARESDLVLAIAGAADVALALQHLQEAVEQALKDARGAIAHVMDEAGVPSFSTDTLNVSLARKPAFVDITDPKLVAPEFWTTPEPAIDRKRIKAALDAGATVTGAVLVRPNDQQLRITVRK